MQHTLSEAAKLAGINRTTIWRHIKQGKLSSSKGCDGKPRVETTELLRVYGELQHPQRPKMQHIATPSTDPLLEQIEHAIQVAVAPLVKEIEQLREQLRLIEYKPPQDTPSTPPPSKAEDDPDWPAKAKSFADLQKRREIRDRYAEPKS